MAIEVRIPTILRTYTDGEKAVTAQGETLAGVIEDLERKVEYRKYYGARMGNVELATL